MSESILRYPYSVPVPGGASEDPGSMFPTGHVDYIKFQAYKTNYNVQNAGRFNRALRDNKDYGKREKSGPPIFLYMPNNLSVTYAPQYNQQNIGLMGGAIAGALGGDGSAASIADELQAFGGNAGGEMIYNTIGKLGTNLNSLIGLGGANIDGNTLMAIAAGKIFNPFQEQVFAGIGFRTFSFDFKMVARNSTESKVIQNIITMMKFNSLPSFAGGDDPAASIGQKAANFTGRASADRFLTVPNRFLISFHRMAENGGKLVELPHFKMDLCALTNLSVNYTPDGQYVAIDPKGDGMQDDTKDGERADKVFVPAVNMSVSFTESSIMTAQKAVAGY